MPRHTREGRPPSRLTVERLVDHSVDVSDEVGPLRRELEAVSGHGHADRALEGGPELGAQLRGGGVRAHAADLHAGDGHPLAIRSSRDVS